MTIKDTAIEIRPSFGGSGFIINLKLAYIPFRLEAFQKKRYDFSYKVTKYRDVNYCIWDCDYKKVRKVYEQEANKKFLKFIKDYSSYGATYSSAKNEIYAVFNSYLKYYKKSTIRSEECERKFKKNFNRTISSLEFKLSVLRTIRDTSADILAILPVPGSKIISAGIKGFGTATDKGYDNVNGKRIVAGTISAATVFVPDSVKGIDKFALDLAAEFSVQGLTSNKSIIIDAKTALIKSSIGTFSSVSSTAFLNHFQAKLIEKFGTNVGKQIGREISKDLTDKVIREKFSSYTTQKYIGSIINRLIKTKKIKLDAVRISHKTPYDYAVTKRLVDASIIKSQRSYNS